MKEKIIISVIGVIVCVGLILGVMFIARAFNAATLQTQVINPRPNIECVVVSAADSTSVDRWKVLQ